MKKLNPVPLIRPPPTTDLSPVRLITTDPFWVHTRVRLEPLPVKEESDGLDDTALVLKDTVLVDEHEASRTALCEFSATFRSRALLMFSLKCQVPVRPKVLGAVEVGPQAISSAAKVSAISVRMDFSIFRGGQFGTLGFAGPLWPMRAVTLGHRESGVCPETSTGVGVRIGQESAVRLDSRDRSGVLLELRARHTLLHRRALFPREHNLLHYDDGRYSGGVVDSMYKSRDDTLGLLRLC